MPHHVWSSHTSKSVCFTVPPLILHIPRALLLLLVSICRLFVFLTRRDKSHLFSGTSEAAQCASVSVHFTQFWDYDITQCRLESKLNTVLKRSQIVSQTVSFRWWQHKTVFTEVATFGGMGIQGYHHIIPLSLSLIPFPAL